MKHFIRLPQSLFLLAALTSSLQSFAQRADETLIKLFRFETNGAEKPGVLVASGKLLDVTAFGEDYNSAFFSTGGIDRLKSWLTQNSANCPEVPANVRLAPCVASPSKIVGIGLNYEDHAKEAGVPVPKVPVLFLKSTTALSGPNDNVIIPLNSVKTDWEAELAIVIGKKAAYVSKENAAEYIAGFTVINDYSERHNQLEGTGQWTKGKSADTFAPLGPYLVLPEDIGDPKNLKIWLTVNGQTMQESNTSAMVFDVHYLVSYVSQYMTLLPGDIIATGTPAGVGLGHNPKRFLKPGDVIALGIEKIGTQTQTAVDALYYILGDEAYRDYQNWVALGLGGIPHTLEGYRRVKLLGSQMGNPLDLTLIKGDMGSAGDVRVLSNLPKRKGQRPTIAPFAVPHRQTNQHNDTVTRNNQKKIFDAQVSHSGERLVYKMSFFEKHSPAIFLADSASGNPTLMPLTHAEIGHIHPSDGSMHMILSPSDTKTVIEQGWGELHGLAGKGNSMAKTYLMIYAPRDRRELEVTKKLLEAAVRYASHIPK